MSAIATGSPAGAGKTEFDVTGLAGGAPAKSLTRPGET
jgi:hypothetical protein